MNGSALCTVPKGGVRAGGRDGPLEPLLALDNGCAKRVGFCASPRAKMAPCSPPPPPTESAPNFVTHSRLRTTAAVPMPSNHSPALNLRGGAAIDLFAGAGGATVGMRKLGLKVRLAVEWDPDAAATYRLNHPRVPLYNCDIRKLDPLAALEGAGLEAGDVMVLNSCPPCQGYSRLYRGEPATERNDLVMETWRWVAATDPLVVLVENVPGLQSDSRYSRLVENLRSADYIVRDWRLDAHDLGAAQRRVRLIMLAVHKRAGVSLDPDAVPYFPRAWKRDINASDVIARAGRPLRNGDPLHRARAVSPLVAKRIAAIPTDGGRFDLPDGLVLECHRRLGRRCATGPYGRIPTKGPSATLTTRCTTASCGAFVHPTETRAISLREAALLQTFPITYRFKGQHQSVERQIGNAVPPMLTAAVLASTLGEH